MNPSLARLNRLLRKPPGHIARRLLTEARHELHRFSVPRRGRAFTTTQLLRKTGAQTIDALWERLLSARAPYRLEGVDADQYERAFPGGTQRVLAAAERACAHEIDLMGSGPVQLGPRIDWHRDFKTGHHWPLRFFRSIDYINRDRPSDAKTVWELSRMQWLVPVGQAYLMTRDERYARAVRDVLEQWIAANPYACSVNWGVTIEPALHIFAWVWFFRVFGRSVAWSDQDFRSRFLKSLYLHGEFTEVFFERNDVNGNHFTADAAGLLAAGSFFRGCADADRWLATCHADLEHEILLQVFPDGVDFEASAAYHRFVAELLLHASLWAEAAGKPFSDGFCERLRRMAAFTASYTRPDGTTPLWGDADDARVIPFGPQSTTDHRYLVETIGTHLADRDLVGRVPQSEESFWTYATTVARTADATSSPRAQSAAFHDGGVYVMRNQRDHVFIDCGPLGLAGRGGHGHNDILSFEAMLDGELLIVDCGSYVYTASFDERNAFRSTAYHNTPRIDGQEVNRFISPDYLWNLHFDAHPQVRGWSVSEEFDAITMSHSGYEKLAQPVRPVRRIELHHRTHCLRIEDRFEGEGRHEIRIPLQFAPGVRIETDPVAANVLMLFTPRRNYRLTWTDAASWSLENGVGRVSPSYGIALSAPRLEWTHVGSLDDALSIEIAPY